MHQSKLIELLRKLSSRQLSRYEEFLASPYFNKNKDNILFFNFLKKYAPTFEHRHLSKEKVMIRLATAKAIDEKGLAYLMNQQIILLEKFIAIESLSFNEFTLDLLLANQYHVLQLPKHYKTVKHRIEKQIDKSVLRNAKYYEQKFLFKSLLYAHSGHDLKGYDETLWEAINALDVFYIVEKLRHASNLENLNTILNTNYNLAFIDEILEWTGNDSFEKVTAIQIYRAILILFKKPEETLNFSKVKIELKKNEHLFTPEETKQLYTLLLNYCTRRINRFNDERFLHEYLDINKRLLENELIFENGQLAPWRYANLVAVGLKTGQMEWTRDFIHKFKNRLPEEYAENMFSYSIAHYHYHRGEHGEAQQSLLYVDFANDVLLNVSARSLLIKIYFETDQTELLLSYLEATRVFLLRNKLLDAQLKRQLQKFVEYTSKLARYGKPERDKLQELHHHLPSPSHIMHHDWVLTQLEKKLG